MKILFLLISFAMLMSMSGCTIFQDNFEVDTVGSPPSTAPAGSPTDDSLNLFGSILVINSVPHSSKAVKIERTSTVARIALECVTGGGSHSTGSYNISYKAYSVYIATVPQLTITLKSTTGQRAFEFILSNGSYRLVSGAGTETLTGGYVASVIHSVSIRIDMDVSKFWFSIDGAEVAASKPFLDASFANVHLLSFEYPKAILEAMPGVYVVDDIKITK